MVLSQRHVQGRGHDVGERILHGRTPHDLEEHCGKSDGRDRSTFSGYSAFPAFEFRLAA